ncbi:preprotein translocase subunit SecG [Leuconostoc citreum]|uniref:preprotein translocase subunit SecG n=1 Tax=Leuconostoc citreum TaxID=33964 RepID=UPI0032DE702F
MYNILIYTMIIINFLVIIFILMQPSKQQDALSLLTGDNNSSLFATQKLHGTNFVLQFATACLGFIWLLLGLILMYFSK